MTDYKKVYLASTRAYQAEDIDGMMEFVSDDFTWYSIVPEGARQLARGREQAKAGIKNVFADIDYLSGHVEFCKTFGDILIAVETDTVVQDGAETRLRRVGVYECADGKLKRCWSFPIRDSDT